MAVPSDWSIQYQRFNNQLSASDPRAVCPFCKNASTFAVLSQIFVAVQSGTEVHLILRCNFARCLKTVYVKTVLTNGALQQLPNNDFFMHPLRSLETPHVSIPQQIADDWLEAQKAMQADAPKAAAVMFRRVLYGVLLDKSCKLFPLRDGMKDLIQGQRLPAIFDDWLPAIRDDGHDGAHPDRALQVSHENISETMEYTSELLRFLYIEPYEFAQRKARNSNSSTAASASISVSNP